VADGGSTRRFVYRVAAVTGAASGLGRATARRLAAEGATVACLDVDESGLEEVVKEIVADGGSAAPYRCDVSDPDDVEASFQSVVVDHGRLDVLCNVAGVGLFASKGGVVLFTKSLAAELLPKRIRVNAVSPGGMNTDMLASWTFPEGEPFDRLMRFSTAFGQADPDDVANVICFVASDEARHMTGAVVPVDGGSTA
jgi:NAD(P)-dependent dehydrogenase (short-subunit alcohol dehydrogenase family)